MSLGKGRRIRWNQVVTAGGRHEEVDPFSAILPLKILSLLQTAKVISNP